MTPELSIIIPGIRQNNWNNVCNSIQNSISAECEIIFIGPQCPNDVLSKYTAVKFIQDFGCPARCAQLALLKSIGQFVIWLSDDCYLEKDVLTNALQIIKNDPEAIIAFKYVEGGYSPMADNNYWKINSFGTSQSRYIPDSYLAVMNALISKDYLISIGGWDCNFEAWAMGNVDLAVRMQRNNKRIVMYNGVLMQCDHMPADTGDHGPIHYTQIEHDQPLYRQIYDNPDCVNRIKIDINNWKNCENIWSKRFNL